MRIIIPGGSGQVGQILARHFQARGHEVIVLSRNPTIASWRVLPWNGVTAGDWQDALEGSDVCINLTGRSVNCRYTPAHRAAILNSRVESTRILGKVIASLAQPPTVWMNASTATFYRHALDRTQDEFTGEAGATSRAHLTPGTSQSTSPRPGKPPSSRPPRHAPVRSHSAPR